MNKLTGVPPNRTEFAGVDLITRSADQGYLPAQLALGYIYEAGKYLASNPSKAADYYRKAVRQGSHLAEYQLGRLYYLGIYGTSPA